MERKVKAFFEFDGYKAVSGNLTLRVDRCHVGEVEVPRKYAVLLVDEEWKDEACRLLREVTALTKVDKAKDYILNTAHEKGFSGAWRLVEKFKAEAPNRKPRFYVDSNWDMTPNYSHIILTDGNLGILFYASFDEKDLPLNVYVNSTYLPLTLSRKACEEAVHRIREFWEFTKRVGKCVDYVSRGRTTKMLQAFFTSKAEAYKLLEDAEADANHKRRREEVFDNLWARGVVKVQEGYLVGHSSDVYHVSEEGVVHKLDYRQPADLREAVYRAVQKGKLPKKLVEVEEEWELDAVGRRIGKLRPDLALVIIP